MRRRHGFTFVELMVTLAVMAVLVCAAVPMAELAVRRQKEQALRAALGEIRLALDLYKRASDQGRIATRLGESGYPKSLQALVEGVEDQRSPSRELIYFMRRLPPDPMADAEVGSAAATWGLRSYASPPDDPSEGEDVFDIYSKSDAVGLNGVPYRLW